MTDFVFRIHDGLPREAPGSTACTHRALGALVDLPPRGRILDVGCGPGAQTIDLARAFGGSIVAFDRHVPYLFELGRRARAANVDRRVHAVRATMLQMPFHDGAFDAIWSEGSIYIAGFERSLREWRRLLRPRGYLAASELCWLVDDPPEPPRAFWRIHYPAMTTVDRNLAAAATCGYEAIDRFVLPPSAWWVDYYEPLERRLAELRRHADAGEQAAIDEVQEQIELYRVHPAAYGYVFFILRRC